MAKTKKQQAAIAINMKKKGKKPKGKGGGLTAKQKKLPPALQKAILKSKTKKKAQVIMALSAATKKTLSEKAAKARKKGKKVTAGQLARVYNKGLAAYRTGHRPGTTPSQWAMARVNSVLTGGKAAKVDAHIFGKGKKPKKKTTKTA